MSNRLYVGNLPFHATHELITKRFVSCGEVKAVDVVLDRDTGRSRGFAFVTMASDQLASEAISRLDGATLDGRALRVNEAEERKGGGGGGRSFGGGGGGGYGGGGGGGGGRRGGGGGGRDRDRDRDRW